MNNCEKCNFSMKKAPNAFMEEANESFIYGGATVSLCRTFSKNATQKEGKEHNYFIRNKETLDIQYCDFCTQCGRKLH